MRHKAGFYEKYIKRLLDIVLSGCALIVLSPLLLVTAMTFISCPQNRTFVLKVL